MASSAFAPNGWIPLRFTCDGENVSPPLAWYDPPSNCRGFALVCSDPDAPGGIWYHWAIYDIPPATRDLPENWSRAGPVLPQAVNDFRNRGYGGPCPPRGSSPHHYHFQLYALGVAQLGVNQPAHCRDVERAARSRAIASAELIGLYARAR